MTAATHSALDTRTLALASMHAREGAPRLNADELDGHLAALPGWALAADRIEKRFDFRDYHATLEFVNAVAWIAHREDHHPDLSVHYNHCDVVWSTHSAGGVTLNDVICAAKIERLFA